MSVFFFFLLRGVLNKDSKGVKAYDALRSFVLSALGADFSEWVTMGYVFFAVE